MPVTEAVQSQRLPPALCSFVDSLMPNVVGTSDEVCRSFLTAWQREQRTQGSVLSAKVDQHGLVIKRETRPNHGVVIRFWEQHGGLKFSIELLQGTGQGSISIRAANPVGKKLRQRIIRFLVR